MKSHSHSTRARSAQAADTKPRHESASDQKQAAQPDYLDLPGVRTLADPKSKDLCIRVRAEQIWYQRKCLGRECKSKDIGDVRPNGTRRQTILDEPRGHHRVRIILKRRCYRCRVCGKAGLLPLNCLVKRGRMTQRLLDYIEKESLLRPFLEVAPKVGLSPKTVRGIFLKRVAAESKRKNGTAPRVLGIDGVYIKRKERAILTDIEQGSIIDIWDAANSETVVPALLCLANLDKVEVITMDMSSSLKSAVQQALPNAVIVIDRYHIQRMANEALDNVRRRLRASVPGGKKQKTMCHSAPLRKHTNQLKEAERLELERWFAIKPELQVAYELKEQFFAIWHTSSKAAAQESYRQWLMSIPAQLCKDFKGIITAMTNWGEYIFNYFDYQYTNAFTESTNRRVKDIQREARNGKFETIKAKAIYGAIVRQQLRAARAHAPNPNMRRARRAKPAAESSSLRCQPPPPIQLQLAFF